jgi:hypothetical protein
MKPDLKNHERTSTVFAVQGLCEVISIQSFSNQAWLVDGIIARKSLRYKQNKWSLEIIDKRL